MSAEVAVVATDVGGTREVIRHGENGFLHAPDDVDGMVETIAGLLREPERLDSIEKAARRTAVERFSVSKVVELYLEIYEEVLG
jgi:glycosyltransferase involved in cell wall biosynthesis